MNFNVVSHLILWYLLFFVSGTIFWLAFHNFFAKLYDRGYAISKIIVMVLVALILWMVGFVFKLHIDNVTTLIIFVGVLIFCLAVKIYFKIETPKITWKKIASVELVFFVMLAIGLFISSFHPAIDNVTERIMDFKLLSELTNTTSLPPLDIWFTPLTDNYYYFGHFFFALINKLTGTDPYMGYLLAMGFIYSLSSAAFFSLGMSIKKSYIVGVLAVAFPLFFSNFTFIYKISNQFLTSATDFQRFQFGLIIVYLVLLLTIIISIFRVRSKNVRIFLGLCLVAIIVHFLFSRCYEVVSAFYNFMIEPGRNTLWYPDVSRVIDSTINEFPFYSIIIGDLHPHFLDIIFTVTILSFIFIDFASVSPISLSQNLSLLKAHIKQYKKKALRRLLKFVIKNHFFRHFIVLKLFTILIFSGGIVANSWELITVSIFLMIKDIIFLFRSIDIAYSGSKFSLKRYFSLNFFVAIADILVIILAFISQTPFIKSVSLPVKGVKLNIINNAQDYIVFFKQNFNPFGLIQKNTDTNGLTHYFVQTSIDVWVLIVGLFLIIIYFFYKRAKSKRNRDMIYYIGIVSAPFLVAILVLINAVNFIKFTFDNFGVDDVIFTCMYLTILYYVVKYLAEKKISKIIFVNFVLLFSTIMIAVSSVFSLIISYVQKNFDLSPALQFFEVYGVYLVIAIVGLAILFKKVFKKQITDIEYFVMCTLFSGIFLSIFTEFFYVADFFDRAVYEHHRANSIFKINYIGFMYFGLGAAWVMYTLFIHNSEQKFSKAKDFILHICFLLLRSLILLSVIGIFLYVPYTLSQWFPFFGNKFLISDKISVVIILILVYLFLIVVAVKLFLYYRLYLYRNLLTTRIPIAIFAIILILTQFSILFVAFNNNILNQKLNNGNYSDIVIKTLSLDVYEQTKIKYPEVIEAAEYLKSIKNNNDILLEVNGDAYKHESVGSLYTLTPSILGWWGHEAQWRETPDPRVNDEILRKRVRDIANMFKLKDEAKETIACDLASLGENFSYDKNVLKNISPIGCQMNVGGTTSECNPSQLAKGIQDCTREVKIPGWRELIQKYKVTYIWVDDTTRTKISQDVVSTLDGQSCFRAVFENFDAVSKASKVKIYKVDRECVSK